MAERQQAVVCADSTAQVQAECREGIAKLAKVEALAVGSSGDERASFR
jgi:hypothetical protein